VRRLCLPRLAWRHRYACLLAAAVATGAAGQARAQLAAPDPMTPRLSAGQGTAPAFQRVDRPTLAQADQPTTFTPPASGAGNTGFDSTNNRRARGRAVAPRPATGRAAGGTDAQASVPGAATQSTTAPAISPYQVPPPGSEASRARAQVRGAAPIENVGAMRDPVRRRRAHVEEDAYAAIGLRGGSFIWYPAIELLGGYDTNPERSSTARGSSLYTVVPELRVQSDWSRHEFKADLRGSYTGYSPDREPTLSRPAVDGRAEGRIDVTRNTRVDATGRLLVSTDNPGSPNLPAGLARLPIFTTAGGSLGLGHRFNRFDLSVKGDAERTSFQDSKLTDGSIASNASRNYDQYAGTVRGGYELSPGLMPFVDFTSDQRKHDVSPDPNGYRRDSTGMTGRVGTRFELSRLLVGEAALGYTKRSYDDPRFSDITGLIGDASLVWTVNALTTVKLTARSNVAESTVPGVSGVLRREAGVEIDHAFRRYLIGSVKAGFGLENYRGVTTSTVNTVVCDCVVSTTTVAGVDREDKRYWLGAGLTYKFNRNLHVKGEFRQEWLRSNVLGNDYSASTFLVGVRWQQ